MNRANVSLFVAFVFGLVPAQYSYAKGPQAPIDPGPQPTIEEFQAQAAAVVVQGFFDPSSAVFQWDRGIIGGYWKPLFQAKIPGWFTCGLVNGKNRFGGYVGFRRFVAVMRDGRIVYSAVGDGEEIDVVTAQCNNTINKGILPPVQSASDTYLQSGGQPSQIPSDRPQFGFSTAAVPDGAYIARVVPNSSAEKAGLTSGMVISQVNGLSIKGLGGASITSLIHGAGDEIILTVIGKGEVKLVRAPIDNPTSN